MEAVMVDAGGPDHISVGVKIPRGGLQRPISSRSLYLIPPGKVKNCFKNYFLSFCFSSYQAFLISSSVFSS
jgi:hypothetical protein